MENNKIRHCVEILLLNERSYFVHLEFPKFYEWLSLFIDKSFFS